MQSQPVSFTIAEPLYRLDFIEKVAKALAVFEQSGKEDYADFLGHYGRFEHNPRAEDIYKIHVADIGGLLSENWKSKRGYNRTSDHFVVYSQHWFLRERFHILAVVTPNAHQRIDSLITALIDKAEAFNAMTKAQIEQLPSYTANDYTEIK